MAVPLVAALVMAGAQVAGGLKQADSIRMNAEMNKRIAEINAKYIDMDAWEAEKYGFTAATRYQSVIDDVISDQRVGFYAQGVDASFGSAAEVQKGSKLKGFLNQLDMIQRARNNAMGLKQQAMNVRFGASNAMDVASERARGAEIGGVLSGASTVAGSLNPPAYASGYSPKRKIATEDDE
jgi:hypothetical protein